MDNIKNEDLNKSDLNIKSKNLEIENDYETKEEIDNKIKNFKKDSFIYWNK